MALLDESMIRYLLALSLLTTLLSAQSQKPGAGYQLFLEGCAGSGGPHVPNANTQGGRLQPVLQTLGGTTAIRFTTTTAVLAQGVDFWTKATAAGTKVPVSLYLSDSAGNPLSKPALTGTMVVGTKLGWYRGKFNKPLLLKAGTRAFVALAPPLRPSRISPPAVQQGFKVIHQYGSAKGTWSKPYRAFHWSWKLVAPPVASIQSAPVVHAPAGAPRIGRNFTVQLSAAPPSAPSLILTGVSRRNFGPIKLPLDLTGAGAPGCQLVVSMDILAFVVVNKSGTAAISFPIPNNTALIKQKFFNQALSIAGKTNQLGLVFSNGGQATIGK